jgi:hypothetical protein
MKIRLVLCLPAVVLVLAGGARAQGASATAVSGPERDVAAVRAAVLHSGEAANAGDPDAVMALYARDIVLSYPGVPDMDYETLARGYREMLRTPGVTLRTAPEIHEILVSGDPPRAATRLARDLQVWRRERDGSWKFARGMHYRAPLPAPADSAARHRRR